MRVAHVITGLGTGGAETMLAKLVEQLRDSDVGFDVISLSDRGDMASRLVEAGATVTALGVGRSILGFPSALMAVRRALQSTRPDVVQTWMYHADLLGGLAARSSGIRPIVWNLRQSNLGRDVNRIVTLMTMWNCARLSGTVPMRIVCNSSAAVRNHRLYGYDESRIVLIPNGFDTGRFRPDGEAKRGVHDELGIPRGDLVLGYAARWDRQKDPESMVEAAARVMDVRPDVHVIFCGLGLERGNAQLADWVARTGHAQRFHLLGRRDDAARLVTSFDIAVSSSIGEGFSNAIGEAMACGVPCVVTDVGDSAAVVGETGLVVPPSSALLLAEAILVLTQSPERRARLGVLGRERIVEQFSIEAVARRYVDVWREAIACAV